MNVIQNYELLLRNVRNQATSRLGKKARSVLYQYLFMLLKLCFLIISKTAAISRSEEQKCTQTLIKEENKEEAFS